jgi:hypothetical protein
VLNHGFAEDLAPRAQVPIAVSEIEPRLVMRIVGCNSPHCDAFMGVVHRNVAY